MSSTLAAEAVDLEEMGLPSDIGGGTVILLFEQGSMLFASVLPIGGDYNSRSSCRITTTIDEAQA